MLNTITPQRAFLIIAAVAFATIAGAWIFEYFGYAPCELCLKQRWAYYVGVPLALILAAMASGNPVAARYGLMLMAALWIASALFGVYHSGVEWKWWPGPSSCTGGGGLSGLPDLSKPIVLCDRPAIRIFGLSLAGWNAVISAALALLALKVLKSQGSSSVSQ
ncbi:MAG: disulfide bond formation protein B [Rhizobiales bacterium]|nr:disulfide bond formation protein B [Hyphomicrobiales bacterium]MBI3674776.1 disulfide bond formation protein B [Hyphomicrobiales bacterium]